MKVSPLLLALLAPLAMGDSGTTCDKESDAIEVCAKTNECKILVEDMPGCYPARRRLQLFLEENPCSEITSGYCCELGLCKECEAELKAEAMCLASSEPDEADCNIDFEDICDADDEVPADDSSACADEEKALDACAAENDCKIAVEDKTGCYIRRHLQLFLEENGEGPPACSELTSGYCCELALCKECDAELKAMAKCEASSANVTNCDMDAEDICDVDENVAQDDSSASKAKVYLSYLFLIGTLVLV